MPTYDLSPLFRSSIGFDHVSKLLDSALRLEGSSPSYPPYNIEKQDEDTYRITMAVAGFTENTIDVVVQDQSLTVRGRLSEPENADKPTYLHRGIATRAFERRFQLADHIRVAGARMENGLLSINLVREIPDALRPRSIPIETGDAPGRPQVIDSAAA